MTSPISIRLSLCLALAALWLSGCASLELDPVSLAPAETDPQLDSRYAQARLCERHQQSDKARAIYQDILAARPQDPMALYRLGVISAKEANYEQAEQYFHQAIAHDRQNAELHNDLGYCLFLQDKLQEAEACFRRSLELSRNYKPAWTNLGLALGQQGDFEASRAAFEQSNSSPAEVHCCMAYVYLQLFQLEAAQAEYRAALTLDPELRIAAQGLLDISRHIPGQTPVVVAATYGAERRQSAESQAALKSTADDSTPFLQADILAQPALTAATIAHPAATKAEPSTR
jgi:tetratricopeptide (TPR) repeat protein